MSLVSSTAKITSTAAAAGFYDFPIEQSLRFDGSSYLSRTPSSASNRKTWTWSGWVKRGILGVMHIFGGYSGTDNNENLYKILFGSDDTFRSDAYDKNWRITNAVYRDLSAWYHFILAFDTTQVTPLDRIKVYVNGQQVNSFSTTNNPQQNTDYIINSNNLHVIGTNVFNISSARFSGYLANIQFIDGQALSASSFGETKSGVWIPKAYTGSYGTNGFHLTFEDATSTTTLGYDYSGNNNHWTLN